MFDPEPPPAPSEEDVPRWHHRRHHALLIAAAAGRLASFSFHGATPETWQAELAKLRDLVEDARMWDVRQDQPPRVGEPRPERSKRTRL